MGDFQKGPSGVEYTSQLRRRDLLNQGYQLVLPAAPGGFAASEPTIVEDGVFDRPPPCVGNFFTDEQRRTLDAVMMCLFPDDGDGPDAHDLRALSYLEWAMTDPVNMGDGDPAFIARGAQWLNERSLTEPGCAFGELDPDRQDQLLHDVAQLKFGRNWLSLLLFYLTEALLLDPLYGANPDMAGWLWLEHRPGFPRPVHGKSCRDFE